MASVEAFSSMSTQWRVGPAGVIGLDYAALAAVMEMLDLGDRRQILKDVQVMESVAMSILREDRA